MRRRISLILTLAAWLLATGSHWDLVQTFAWGRMIANYSQTVPLAEAIRLTFTPENMCGVCSVVATAKQDSDPAAPSAGKLDGKVLLVFSPIPAPVVAAPSFVSRIFDPSSVPISERAAPPVPPPRHAV